ncbi:MAG: hypothetical protein K6B14_06565 [Lachnospiraceae bacterium]|nr:hypothetical protein [Lachnospiraceae bacterium]
MKRSSSILMGLFIGASLVLGYSSSVFATPADHVDFTVDGVDYVVSERYSDEEMPEGFTRETVEIGGHTYSEPVGDKMKLLYLKPAADTSGSGEFYIYDESAGSVEPFFFLGSASNYVIPKQGDASVFTRLSETTITVNDQSIPVFQLEDSTNDFYYVYGVDANGEEEWYTYRESTGEVARADTYALFLTSQTGDAETEEGSEDEQTEEKKESAFSGISGISGDKVRNILVVVVIVIAIIIIFFINLKVFRRSDEDDDIWAEPEEDETTPVKPAAAHKKPEKAEPRAAEAKEDVRVATPRADVAASDEEPEKEAELPTEEAILKNAMAGIMSEPEPKKVASAIDSLPKRNSGSGKGTTDDTLQMIDLDNL